MLTVTGILIIIGGAMFFVDAAETENLARMAGEGGGLTAIGIIIAILGGIKIKKS
ncbi:MAG: hypothetical protein QQN61_07880 [Nitrosopumilus sp.]